MQEEYDEILISTPIDQMIQIIKEQGEVSLEYLSVKLKYDPETIEEWGRYLEREGIIDIDYSLGKTVFKWNAPTQEEKKKRVERIQRREIQVEEELKKVEKEVKVEEGKLAQLLEGMGSQIQQLREEKEKIKEFFAVIEDFKTSMLKENAKLHKEYESLQKELLEVSNRLNALKLLVKENSPQEIKELINEIEGSVARKVELLNKEIEDLEKIKEEALEKLKNVPDSSTLEDFKKELYDIKSQINSLRSKLPKVESLAVTLNTVSNLIESKDAVLREYEELQKEIEHITQELSMVSGPIEVMEKKIKELSDRLNELQRKASELAEQVIVNAEIAKNLENVIDPELLKEAISLQEKLEKWEQLLESAGDLDEFYYYAQELGKILERINHYLDSYKAEVGRVGEVISQEIKSLEALREISDNLVSYIENYQKDLESIENKIAKLNLALHEKLEEAEHVKEQMDLFLTSDSFLTGLKVLENIEERLETIDQHYETVKKLYGTLEEIKNHVKILQKELEILRLREPEAVSDKAGEIEEDKRKIEDIRKKRRDIEEWLKSLWEKKD